ncbi:protein translocase subunit SecDF [Fulvivirgaceae bacterium BMA10]|uniref:Multifunctional fusion protein n=1 Tax=Splendidivirga corallicola TaxID=3051826 RepID=A0ABT8KN14_9BACT|nr:protein translocase subunit SecDF [Fulvivirgaceae bacterium BMA10]
MRNKGTVILLTVIVTLLCLYYLSFTFVSRNIKKEATAYATTEAGVDFSKRRSYLDSVWTKPVYSLFGLVEYTYEEVKENELNLGLDLQGGMHVTLEVTPDEIIKALSDNSQDPDFLKAIENAKELQKTSQASFVDLFYQSFQEVAPGKKLSTIFTNATNRDRVDFDSSDDDVLDVINDEVTDAIDRSFNILRTRLDAFGTSQPNIQKIQGTGRIQIELPGVDDAARVRKLLQGIAKLEFWEVAEYDEYATSMNAINELLLAEELTKASELSSTEDGTAENTDAAGNESEALASLLTEGDSSTVQDDTTNLEAQLSGTDSGAVNLDSLSNLQTPPLFRLLRLAQGDTPNRIYLSVNLSDTMEFNRMWEREEVQALIPSHIKFRWQVKPDANREGVTSEFLEFYPLKIGRGGKAPLDGDAINTARQSLDQYNRPAVSMTMNANGAKVWKRLTGENVGRRIAIVLDNKVISAPNVINEIPNGQSEIAGNFTIDEATDLANLLKAGKLPARTRIVADTVIGPTLGEVARQQGIVSIVSGLVIVVVFMVFYYAKGGFVANAALIFNIFFIIGILAQLKSALTLPGMAGIVLTIGMSIDANVLIFERIREELRNGSALLKAISTGYKKAYSSIVDANATTLLTAIILYVLGEGPVKGFAITLMIGIICSFFSAVFITRVIIEWMSKKGDQSKISFATPFSSGWLSKLNLDFLSKRKIAYVLSSSFIAIGIIAIIIKGGLNFGVDFKGGRAYVVTFPSQVVTSDLEVALTDDFENNGTEVKTFGASNVLKVTTSYLVEDESDEADQKVKEAMIAGIEDHTKLNFVEDDAKVDEGHFTISSSSKVGATIADDIKNSSQRAVIFSLIVIFLYILVRFRKWQFGLGAIVALFHDALFVISAFAIARLLGISFEIDQVFIGAILTIIGYSINDTVVVFDRIRETLGLRGDSDIQGMFNLSINNTISRTLITSVTTLIVVVILLIFGGAILRGFSFAMVVGILIGTYSSVFIASPIVVDLTKKSLAREVAKQKA